MSQSEGPSELPPVNGSSPEVTPPAALVFGPKLFAVIALAAFLTDFAQTGRIASVPIQFLILKHMHLHAKDLAAFSFLSAIAWYFKPLAGLILDSVPFLHTRRRSYMVAASFLSMVTWLLMGFASRTLPMVTAAAILVNVFMMVCSTAMGALLVQFGHSKAASGGLSSLREGLSNISLTFVGIASGALATLPFRYTGFVGAGLMLILFLGSYFFLDEKPTARTNTAVWHTAGLQIKELFSSKQLLSAALMMLLIFLAPGFSSLLSDIQVNTLHFSPKQVGLLATASGITGIAASLVYGIACRFINLRPMLVIGIVFNVASTLVYFYYHSFKLALIIDPANGFMGELAILPVYDLALRATPRGGEGLGFAVMMAVRNLALFGSNWAGAYCAEKYHISFDTMLVVNAGFTALVLILVPFIPRSLVARRDGQLAGAAAPA